MLSVIFYPAIYSLLLGLMLFFVLSLLPNLMRRFSNHTALHTLSELNVTPLLDLAFVLLIIFMITTPLLENSIDLVVPTSTTAQKEVNPSKVQIISIDREEVIKLNEKICSLEELSRELTTLKAADPALAVMIRPHKDLSIQKFVSIMDLLHKLGITKVGVMTHPEALAPKSPEAAYSQKLPGYAWVETTH